MPNPQDRRRAAQARVLIADDHPLHAAVLRAAAADVPLWIARAA